MFQVALYSIKFSSLREREKLFRAEFILDLIRRITSQGTEILYQFQLVIFNLTVETEASMQENKNL